MLKEKFFAGTNLLYCLFIYSIYLNNYGYAKSAQPDNDISLIDDSYRLILDLRTPRRFATRFDKETRTLQVRIIPAKAEEIKNSSFYDTRYIQRIVLQEKESEVILNIQLKNFPIGWVIATQKDPWRILIDFWRTEKEKISLNEQWDWQSNYISGFAGEKNSDGLPSTGNIKNSKNINTSLTPILVTENSKLKINPKDKNSKGKKEINISENKNIKKY